jgi:hypothetical protein
MIKPLIDRIEKLHHIFLGVSFVNPLGSKEYKRPRNPFHK